MIKKYHNMGILIAPSGFVIQIYGDIIKSNLIMASGIILIIIGLCYYAMGKGRHPAFGLFGILSIIGIIILSFFEDKSGKDEVKSTINPFLKFILFLLLFILVIIILPSLIISSK